MLTPEVYDAIERSVLCWLATADEAGFPNVSPKEVFAATGDNTLLIANIASPGSVRNILVNDKVSVAFIDVFLQKGFKLNGKARVVKSTDASGFNYLKRLESLTQGRFPIHSIIEIQVEKVSHIEAPSYRLFGDVSETEQVQSALLTYASKLMKTGRRLPE